MSCPSVSVLPRRGGKSGVKPPHSTVPPSRLAGINSGRRYTNAGKMPALRKGRPEGRPCKEEDDETLRLILRAADQQVQDDAAGNPIVALIQVGAERSPVVVEIEQADVDASGRVDV